MAEMAIAARNGALGLLTGVLTDKRLLSEDLAGRANTLAPLAPPDRARAQRLALGVLRHLARLDAVLAGYLETPPPPRVKNILRLSTYELLLEDAPAHGVVNSAVILARKSGKSERFAGLVNAVLRKVSREGAEKLAAEPVQALPSWLAKPVARQFGKDAVLAIAKAHALPPPTDLTLKTPADGERWAAKLDAELLPTGSLRLHTRGQISALPGFEGGEWWVQDAAAALPARLLGRVEGLRVADICAAPGGKTLQLAASGASVTALDVSAVRMTRLADNLGRVGLQADCVTADLLNWAPDQPFDAVLLDAPCSATGTIRRHPDLPFAKAGADLSALFDLQARMLDKALDLLNPGGRLVYCTCSLLDREGERQIASALERHPGLKIVPIDPLPLGIPREWLTDEGGLRTRPDYWPERGGMDGFYMAVLGKA